MTTLRHIYEVNGCRIDMLATESTPETGWALTVYAQAETGLVYLPWTGEGRHFATHEAAFAAGAKWAEDMFAG